MVILVTRALTAVAAMHSDEATARYVRRLRSVSTSMVPPLCDWLRLRTPRSLRLAPAAARCMSPLHYRLCHTIAARVCTLRLQIYKVNQFVYCDATRIGALCRAGM